MGSPVARLFSDQHRLLVWTEIELLAVEARDPVIAAYLRANTTVPTPAEVAERERTTDHDVAAFVDCLQQQHPSQPVIAGYIHHGLTSSDVADTALSLIVCQAIDLILAVARPRARRLLGNARQHMAVGKLSGAVGTYSNVSPRIERFVCAKLGLRPVPATQVLARDRHAEVVYACAMVALTPAARSLVSVALEDVALWHERDISHSSVERIILPQALEAAYLTESQAYGKMET